MDDKNLEAKDKTNK